ncbi:MAG: ParB/RepB/Spo0J family partition protein [Clostridiales bacterium]|nr:ParB/RepB/Spo0J family partition protein [Clostridiales bacterium]
MNKLVMINIDDIIPNPNQPRLEFQQDKLNELADSIQKVGLIQPLVVRKSSLGYELIAGERRLRASKLIGMSKIPAIVYEVNDIGSAAIALVENIQREQLNYMDEAISYKRLVDEHQLTQQQIATIIGKSQSSVANKIRLLKHSKPVISKLRDNGLTERHSRALLDLIDEDEKLSTIDHIVKRNLNVSETEKFIELKNTSIKKRKQKVKGVIRNYKMYINTIKNAINEITNAGVNAAYDVDESDDEIIIMIKIKK